MFVPCLTTLVTAALILSPSAMAGDVCKQTAKLQKKAAALELKEDFKVAVATCNNIDDPDERKACLKEAKAAWGEGRALAKQQFLARLDLCEKLGGGSYDPVIDPEDFSTEIDNPYLPLPVGAEWVYESLSEDGLETIVVTVLEETRELLGVECVSVRDTVSLGGVLVEDTIDWYAQDTAGNVWYFGEISFNYDDEGFVADIDGSWFAGEEGAKPGIVMLGDPALGTTYRQEWWLGEAEDAGTVIDDDATVTIGLGTFSNCVKTEDFLPPEPDALENKFFAPGIGFIHETKADSDETVDLISFKGL
jgi:hypothetical protein